MSVEIPVGDLIDDVYVEVSCNVCGQALEVSWWHGSIVVDPCEKCMDNNYEVGLDEGRNEI